MFVPDEYFHLFAIFLGGRRSVYIQNRIQLFAEREPQQQKQWLLCVKVQPLCGCGQLFVLWDASDLKEQYSSKTTRYVAW